MNIIMQSPNNRYNKPQRKWFRDVRYYKGRTVLPMPQNIETPNEGPGFILPGRYFLMSNSVPADIRCYKQEIIHALQPTSANEHRQLGRSFIKGINFTCGCG